MRMARRLETERLVLRLPVAEDFPAYQEYCASKRAEYVGGPFHKYTAFTRLSALVGHWELRGFGRYVIERKTFPGGIGHVGIMLLDDGDIPEFTWTLWDGRHEGRGLMSEAAEAVKDHLMRDCGWDQIIARISPENRASRRMATRLGMVRDERAIAPAWYQGALTYHFEEAA